jgi:hypothetical protein
LSGAFLIKSALCLNLCVCGCLMKPVSVEPSEIMKRNKKLKALGFENPGSHAENRETSHLDPSSEVVKEAPIVAEIFESNDNLADKLNRPKILVSDEQNNTILPNSFYKNGQHQSQPHDMNGMPPINKRVFLLRNHSSREQATTNPLGLNSSNIDNSNSG